MPRAASTSEPAGRWLAVALLVLAGCSPAPALVERLFVFGSETTVEIRGADSARASAAIAESARLLERLEREWHPWEDSDLTRLNAAIARGESAPVPDSLLALARESDRLHRDSEGWFDPAVGGLVELWGFHTSDYPVKTPAPSREQVAQWRARAPGFADVFIEAGRIGSRNPAVALDFAAVAEGAAGREVLSILRRHGIRHALLSMGGDVLALGDGDGRPWHVGMRDPFGGVLGGVELRDGEGFFTSGNYNKFRAAPDGGRWGHILNPRTGMPAEGTAATAVLHPDPLLADAASTALMAAGPSGFERLARRMGLGCALLLTDENELMVTRGMQQRMSLLRSPVPLGPALDLGPGCKVGGR